MGMVIGLVLLVVLKRSKALESWRKNGCKMAPDVVH